MNTLGKKTRNAFGQIQKNKCTLLKIKVLLFLMSIFTYESLQRISMFLNSSYRCFNLNNLVWTK